MTRGSRIKVLRALGLLDFSELMSEAYFCIRRRKGDKITIIPHLSRRVKWFLIINACSEWIPGNRL